MRRTHVIAVLALALSATVLPAVSTAASTSAGGHRAHAIGRAAAADRALRRADAVLGGVEGAEQDATLALRDLVRAMPSLDAAERERARGLLARPTSRTDPFGDYYRAPSKRTCSTNVCVHWVSRTSDAPPSRAWVTRTMDVMKEAWAHEVGSMGYSRPVPDGKRGGDGKLDVYLKDVGANGIFGYCAPERRTQASRWTASGYCVLDDDFASAQFDQKPVLSLKATAAHEFFHEIQFAYDFAEDAWFMEATATWMEERVFDDVNDNRRYLDSGQLAFPGRPLDIFEDFGAAQYGNWVFFEYLSHRFGDTVVQSAWQEAAAVGDQRGLYSIRAIEESLTISFPEVFGEYAAANTAPALTFPEGVVYPEGNRWPAAPVARKHLLTNADRKSHGSLTVDHLASKNVSIKPGAGINDPGWQLRVTIDGPARASQVANVLVRGLDGSIERMPVTPDGAPVTVPFDVRKVTVTVANASTRYNCRRQTAYSCDGDPRDDAQPFGYRVVALPPG